MDEAHAIVEAAQPLEIALVHSLPMEPTDDLVVEILRADYPDLRIEAERLVIPQRWMLWATPEGDPVWAEYIIEKAEPWEIGDFGLAVTVTQTPEELAAMPGWLVLREDLKGGNYSAHRRIGTLRALASAIEKALPPTAVAWRGSRCVTNGIEETWPLGILSVRRAEGSDGIVMDTLGGYVFGVPDFQCGFADLDDELVADELLWRTLRGIEESETISDGDPVICLKDPDLWFAARHARSTLEPQRDVIALVPPADNARGDIIER